MEEATRSTKLIRGLISQAPAGFQSRRGRSYRKLALVTFQYAAFPTYKAQYLKIYPDVAAEVQRGTFLNGYHHYLTAGRAEGRKDGTPPSDWNEALYLRLYPDVAAEVQRDTFVSGYHHYLVAGRAEGRNDGKPPNNWNEELYLRVNPDVQHEVTRGTFLSGYHHYLVNGRSSAHRVDLR